MARADKVAEAIRQEVSIIIHDKLKDPRLGFVTITRVDVAADLRNARIFYSVLGDEAAHKSTKEALSSALGLVRKLVAERINLKFAPEIMFSEDRSTEYSVRIQQVLDEIKQEDEFKKAKVESDAKGKEAKHVAKKSKRKHKKI
jgi:ribosome-binding factor A